MKISFEIKERIEIICDRFDNDISQIDIVNWLSNFQEEDWEKALTVLEYVDYYSYDRILACYKSNIEKIINDHSGQRIIIYPLGNIGKSGHFVAYFIKKVIRQYFSNHVKMLDDKVTLSVNDIFLYVDDFAGSGQTFVDNRRYDLPQGIKECYLTIAYMDKAAERASELNVEIYGDAHKPCFAPRGSVFGYSQNMLPIREFCFKYGNRLYPLDKVYEHKKENILSVGPFGFANSQALVAFDYGTPNNTLPILWANKKWTPIFPRFVDTRIENEVKYRSGQDYWLSFIYREKLAPDAFLHFQRYSTTATKLFLLVRLKRRNKKPTFICQYLGISEEEMENLERLGASLSLFDTSGQLTDEADTFYRELYKRMRIIISHKPAEKIYEVSDLYLPKSFQGKS